MNPETPQADLEQENRMGSRELKHRIVCVRGKDRGAEGHRPTWRRAYVGRVELSS